MARGLALWLALGVVEALALLVRRRRAALAVGLVALASALATRSCGGPGLRIATFNIREYGRPLSTDDGRLRERIEQLDADVLAVQEIRDEERLAALVKTLRRRGGHYDYVLSRCGGERQMHVGFVFDRARVTLVHTSEFPELDPDGGGSCDQGQRPGLLAEFRRGGEAFGLLAVHLKSGRAGLPARREQWRAALTIVERHRARRRVPVAIVGDANTAGFLDNDQGERDEVRSTLGRAGLRLLTERLGCSEYFAPEGSTQFLRSLLDHIAVPADFPVQADAQVHGYCAEIACRPVLGEPKPRDFQDVSDHCPVVAAAR